MRNNIASKDNHSPVRADVKGRADVKTDFYQLVEPGEIGRQTIAFGSDEVQADMRNLNRLAHIILWLEPFWLLALAPSLLFRDFFWDPWLHPWLIGALFLFWPVRMLLTKRLAPPTPLNKPIYGILLWTPVGLWMAQDLEQAWHTAGFLALGITFYVAFLNWSPMQQRPWLVALCIGLCGVALSAVGPDLLARIPSEFIFFSDEITRSKPVNIFGWGETVNPNVLAGALLLPIPLLTTLAIRTSWAKRRWLPPLLLLAVLPMLATLILAQSRGSYLAVTLALLCVFVLRWPWSGIAMAVAFVTVAVVLSLDGAVLFLGAFGSDGTVTSFNGRVAIWHTTIQALFDHPLTGIGLGQFNPVVHSTYPSAEWNARVVHAHNLFLQIGMDLGLPGMLLYAWVIGAALRGLVLVIRNDGYTEKSVSETVRPQVQKGRSQQRQRVHARREASLRWALAGGALAALVGMLVHGFVDAVTWGTKLAFLPWLIFALTALLLLQEIGEDAQA